MSQINLIQQIENLPHPITQKRILPRAKLHHVKLITYQCRIHHCIDVVLLILEKFLHGFASCTFHQSFLVKPDRPSPSLLRWWINPQVLFKVNSLIHSSSFTEKKKHLFLLGSRGGSFTSWSISSQRGSGPQAPWQPWQPWLSYVAFVKKPAAKRMFYLDVIFYLHPRNQHFLF